MTCPIERTGNGNVMGVFDAPTWVLAAWRRSLQDVGATADQARLEAYGERMIERWSAPERIHHNLRRLIAVLARVDELAPETHDPNVVRLAAWYHGAVFNAAAQHAYARRGGVDEPASAELARTELTELGVPVEVVDRIAALILGIARHAAPKDDIDAQALCDADLGGLAAEPQRYAAYRKEVRAEYAHIPREDYVRARLAIVTKLLDRTHLFQSPMAQIWEDAARENLTAELDRLTAEAAQLATDEDERLDAAAEGRSPRDEHAGPAAEGVGAQAGDGGARPGQATSPAGRGVQELPAVPEEVELPDGGPGPGGFEPREVEDPGATGHTPSGTEQEARQLGGASIENAPVADRPVASRSAADPREGDAEDARTETVAERSQRRWAEHRAREVAEQEAAQRGGPDAGRVRRRSSSAPSPLEPGAGDTGPNEGVPGASDDLDETSSLSRPPRMPAIKRRPPAADHSGGEDGRGSGNGRRSENDQRSGSGQRSED